jgi:hypothetical protein
MAARQSCYCLYFVSVIAFPNPKYRFDEEIDTFLHPSLPRLKAISTQENFPLKENFVKCDWPTQIFRRKRILKLKIFNF